MTDVIVGEDVTDHENGIEWSLNPLKNCIKLLPPGNRTLLLHLANFLSKLESNSSTNYMTASNIATCFAPIVVRRELDPTDMATYIKESKKAERFIECMILHTKFVFSIKVSIKKNFILHFTRTLRLFYIFYFFLYLGS